MNKMQIAIYPKLYSEKPEVGCKIKLSLIGSGLAGLAGVDGLQRLIDSIQNVLAYFKYSRLYELQEVINRYEEIKDFKKPTDLTYNIATVNSDDLKYLKTAIMREAEIRLFNCNINIEVMS